MIDIAGLPTFDMAEYLQSPEDIATYLQLALDDEDPGELAHALGVIARVRGMTEIAQKSGLGREALDKALRPGSRPRFETIARVMKALDIKLTATPLS
ncbi:addiction module antidote protein [uncultured Cardiobacterium sp.]|uniref:addiction module antidote protein n=1 Tax=uncultured Cardiobacterium sp. TaxID=417619 RepID=UPI00261B59B9|nr:addiction module antidote protein [uncultured Cardiobacterium sp.]